MRRFVGFVALAACTSAPPPEQATMVVPATAWLAKFAPALRFVPTSVVAVTFADHRSIVDPRGGSATHLEIRCEPELRIEDHGSYGVPRERIDALGESHASVLDVPVWTTQEPETWVAFVDDRFVLQAANEGQLTQALRRERPDGLADFAALPPIDPATTDLALRAGSEQAALARWIVERCVASAERTGEARQ